ncbi:MAG: cellulase family glycosylhydrolase [Spirochaetales bacterium]|nr:cellulase family glycosylhydrolase [Spirochaetales bacterium]
MEFPEWEDDTIHNYWWGGNPMGVADNPVNLGSNQNKLVYSPHDYGSSVWDQIWFDPDVFNEANMHMVWSHYWFFIYENNTAPLFIGEWGGKLDNPDNAKWMGYLRDFIVSNRIHHIFWCLNKNSSDTGGILTGGAWDGVDYEKYNFIEPTLWQDSSGRYVGFDHEVPPGPDGITITGYYSGSTQPPGTATPTPGGTATPVITQEPGITGDANGDGSVDIVDALLIAQYYVGLISEFC